MSTAEPVTAVKKQPNTENLRKVLKASVNKQGEGNLEQHLQKLFNFLLQHYPNQALAKFEEASYLLKSEKDISQFMRCADEREYACLAKDLEAYTAQMQKAFLAP